MPMVVMTVHRPEVHLPGAGHGHPAERDAREGKYEFLVHGVVPFFVVVFFS